MERAEHSKPYHEHGAADTYFPGHLPPTWTGTREKVVGESFLIRIYLTSYCIAISKLPLIGQAWDKPGLSETFHWHEWSVLGMSPFPNKPGGDSLLETCCLGLPDLRVQGNPFLNRSTHTQCVTHSWGRMQISLCVSEKPKFSTVVTQDNSATHMKCHWAILQHIHRAKRDDNEPWSTQVHPRVWQMLAETAFSQLISSEAH